MQYKLGTHFAPTALPNAHSTTQQLSKPTRTRAEVHLAQMTVEIKWSRSRKNAPVKERTNQAIFTPNESIWTVDLSLPKKLAPSNSSDLRNGDEDTLPQFAFWKKEARRQKRKPNNSHIY